MRGMKFEWKLGWSQSADSEPEEWIPAEVPGAVQLDYAKAKNLPDYWKADNFRQFRWMEDYYFVYETSLHFSLQANEVAHLAFGGISYQYIVLIDDAEVYRGEGMFSPFRIDVSPYAGQPHRLRVLIFPIPKATNAEDRTQAQSSCIPPAGYSWDWHPRLVPVGLWEDCVLEIEDACGIETLEAHYALNDALDVCRLKAEAVTFGEADVEFRLLDETGAVVAAKTVFSAGKVAAVLRIESPRLWYPVGYGEQPLYTLEACAFRDGVVVSKRTRTVGFRRVKLLMNEGTWDEPRDFPKSRSVCPITLQVNGIRIFAKGSNWVNGDIFPHRMTEDFYREMLSLARDANMNILRVWGGGFFNRDPFFELCDQLGILVWQEFTLACNEYPDSDDYLSVLEQEATLQIKRLRTHPCLCLWCGGNELFNNWSRMTDQKHALRLLNALTYSLDRFTPFLPTSPVYGMAHGHYVNYDEDYKGGTEWISVITKARQTAYTEFGCPGPSPAEYIKTFLPQSDYEDCNPENPLWVAHHAFEAWGRERWLRRPEAAYYFGGWCDTDDLIEKLTLIQCISYKSMFEEMRRQWPYCSMALNWCFNEPWPTAANNSLINWPAKPKPAYYAVKDALRPQLASLRVERHLYWGGENFSAEIHLINDTLCALGPVTVAVYYTLGGKRTYWGKVCAQTVAPQSSLFCGSIGFSLPDDLEGAFEIELQVEKLPQLNSTYTYLCRTKHRGVSPQTRMLNL